MSWSVEYSSRALKQLRKLDAFDRALILRWIDANLEGCENPRVHDKALTGNLSGLWRYRVGGYRILCQLEDGRLTIHAMEIGHRREIYSAL